MDLEEYATYDGAGLAQLVKQRKVTAKELAELMLEGVDKINPKINAVIETYSESVRALANNHGIKGIFGGVPFLLKDIGATEQGRRQESGSRLKRGFVADQDTFLTSRFKETGLTLLGRTTTPEFALASTTESVLMGATRNPWNLEMMAGGSSGGSAACVAAGILPVAHASDGGGSIRIPASACGVVGLKPSRGRVTFGPNRAESWGGLSQEFVVSRSVRDTALMLDAVSQPMLGDPFIVVQPQRPYREEVNAPTGKLRIAWTTNSWRPDVPVDKEVIGCIEEVANESQRMGHEVSEASPIFDYEEYLIAFSNVISLGVDVGIDILSATLRRPVSKETLEPVTLSYYHYAKGLTSKDLVRTDELLNKIRRTFGAFFQKYDILLTPTLSLLPQPIGKYALSRSDLEFVEYNRLTDEINMHTAPVNIIGYPAVSLPLGQSKSALPIGAQFIARFGDEATLIRLASAFEHNMPWLDRIPPVHVSR